MLPEVPKPLSPAEVLTIAVRQEKEGAIHRLRGAATLETTEMRLQADEVDYNEDTGDAEARGNVRFENFQGGEVLEAERVIYNVTLEAGQFYNVRGSTPAKIEAKPGVLTTTSPFSFAGKWAERRESRYILYDGFITNCRLPKPWWRIRGPEFDIVPGQRAIARNSVFRLRGVPLFYTPYFYKSLERLPRKSGFLTPSIGNSNRDGQVVSGGYYWAINRSYDLSYRGQYFTIRGLASNVEFRGKPRQGSDFNLTVFGVADRGRIVEGPTLDRDGVTVIPTGGRLKEGGYQFQFKGQSDLGRGWTALGIVNYLSSITFRQAFTFTFSEAINSEVNSLGYATRHWGYQGVNVVLQRVENYQTNNDRDRIVIRRLPQVEYVVRDRPLWLNRLPLFVSLDAQAGAVRRNQPQFQTRQYVERLDAMPRISTAIQWKNFHVVPSFSTRQTYYGSRLEGTRVTGAGLLRSSREFAIDVRLPSLARIFDSPLPAFGEKLKHVIEPYALYRHVAGVRDFYEFVRIDEAEVVSNTQEVEVGLVNRIYTRRTGGNVDELLSWSLAQRRFFDPTFGGAVQEPQVIDEATRGRRQVLASALQLTGFAFLDRPRNYSPVVSRLMVSPLPRTSFEWRADYDPLRSRITNSLLTADVRFPRYFFSLAHTQVDSVRLLSPQANQFRVFAGFGQENQRGWNTAASADFDFRTSGWLGFTSQVTYNSDCCGFSFQLQQLNYANQQLVLVRMAFVIANIGSFGNLRRQERMF